MTTVEEECAAQLKRLEFIALNSGIPLGLLATHTHTGSEIEAVRRGQTPLSHQTACRIHTCVPTFSIQWLLTGKIPIGADR